MSLNSILLIDNSFLKHGFTIELTETGVLNSIVYESPQIQSSGPCGQLLNVLLLLEEVDEYIHNPTYWFLAGRY